MMPTTTSTSSNIDPDKAASILTKGFMPISLKFYQGRLKNNGDMYQIRLLDLVRVPIIPTSLPSCY